MVIGDDMFGEWLWNVRGDKAFNGPRDKNLSINQIVQLIVPNCKRTIAFQIRAQQQKNPMRHTREHLK